MSEHLDSIDKSVDESVEDRTDLLLQKNKNTSSSPVFIVPQQDDNTTTTNLNELINNFNPHLNDEKKVLSNKPTLISLNLNSHQSSSPIKLPITTTTPIKSSNEFTTTKMIVSPLNNQKKVIISTPSQTTLKTTTINATNNNISSSNMSNTSGDKPIITSFNNRLPVSNNTKIFTISTQNNIKTVSQQQITPISSGSISNINTTSFSNNVNNNNPNKIQYVKIVNTPNNLSNVNKPIKITTISANTNTNLITTTTTNNNNNNSQSQSLAATNLDSGNRSLSSVLQSITPVVNSKQHQSNESNSETSSSALTDALNSSINSQQSLKLHTYQLVTPNNQQHQQPKITATTKTPVIQRIQSVNQFNNQPITKTIVSATTSSTKNMTQQSTQLNNYKVLTQQLPTTSTAQQSNQFSFKSLNTNNNNGNKISITKTISSNNSADDLTRKQVITTVKTSDNTAKQPITQIASTVTSSSSITINPSSILAKHTTPISISTNLSNTQPTLDEKTTLDAFSKIFNTTSVPPTLASSPPSLNQNLSPSKQRLNINRNSVNYDQSSMSPTSQTAVNSATSSSNRKPCNCTKSMCLKLYCDCFAMGSFCHDCNCINCFNTLEHEDDRNKAIKMVLDRNPQAFQSKIGKFTAQIALPKPVPNEELIALALAASNASNEEIDEIQSRHIKGCNCKKSNCLKRYCECYLAKIQCSTLCKCVGCKNCDESTKSILQLANAPILRKSNNQHQHLTQVVKNGKTFNSHHNNYMQSSSNGLNMANSLNSWRNNSMNRTFNDFNSFNSFDLLTRASQDHFKIEQQQNLNRSYATVTNQAIEVTCSRLIEKVADEINRLNFNSDTNDSPQETTNIENIDDLEPGAEENLESLIIEEFGKCLLEIIDTAEKR